MCHFDTFFILAKYIDIINKVYLLKRRKRNGQVQQVFGRKANANWAEN